jgi:hypothetical protein
MSQGKYLGGEVGMRRAEMEMEDDGGADDRQFEVAGDATNLNLNRAERHRSSLEHLTEPWIWSSGSHSCHTWRHKLELLDKCGCIRDVAVDVAVVPSLLFCQADDTIESKAQTDLELIPEKCPPQPPSFVPCLMAQLLPTPPMGRAKYSSQLARTLRLPLTV